MGRYSDISRGPELQDAHERYQAWLRKSRAQKKQAYNAIAKAPTARVRVERVPGWILPFNSDNTNIYLQARIVANNQAGAGAQTANFVRELVDDRVLEAPPTTAGAQTFRASRYRFAKIIASRRTDTATRETESRITGIPYKLHRSDNVSSPFGRANATDNYADAVKAIQANGAYRTFLTTLGNRISFSPEVG